jgi:hypothetical protein
LIEDGLKMGWEMGKLFIPTSLTQINWKFLKVLDKCLKTWGTAGVTYERGIFLPQKTRKLPLRH